MYPLEAATPVFDALILNSIIAHADIFPDSEVCGLIVRNHDDSIKVIESDNESADSKTSFTLDRKLFAAAQEQGEILAVYHSHWSDEQPAMLGFDDVRFSKRLNIPYLLFHTIDRTWDYFDPANLNPFPLQQRNGSSQSVEFYLGWRWLWNRADCYTLMRNYFRGVLDIELADYERSSSPKRQHLHPYKSFEQGMPEIGFQQLPYGTALKNHDVVLMAIDGDISHHCGVIVDASQKHLLHHYGADRLSEKTIYGSDWAENTRSIWRHKDLQ